MENDKNMEDALRDMDNNPRESKEEKQGLTDLENASKSEKFEKFPDRVEKTDYAKQDIAQTNQRHGYFTLDAKSFPSKGRFYNDDIKIQFKAASVKDIRMFSVLDEENIQEVDEALVDLLSSCVRISRGQQTGSWKDLLEEDRLFVILSIRELTFADGENKVAFPVKCESCGTENKMEIINDNFQQRELDESVAKYYSSELRMFDFSTKSFGSIKIKPPTVGIMRIVHKYIKSLQERKVKIKEYMPFLKTLPYMIDDWRSVRQEDINNYRVDFMRWDKKKFNLYTELVAKSQVSVKEEMMKHCDNCHDPIEAEIQLPTGIKGLFIESGILDDELI